MIPDADITALKQRVHANLKFFCPALCDGEGEWNARGTYYEAPAGRISGTTGAFFPIDQKWDEKDPIQSDVLTLWQVFKDRSFTEAFADLTKLCAQWESDEFQKSEEQRAEEEEQQWSEVKELIAEALFGERDLQNPPRSDVGFASEFRKQFLAVHPELKDAKPFKTDKAFTALLRSWIGKPYVFTVAIEKEYVGKKGNRTQFRITENTLVDRMVANRKSALDAEQIAEAKQRRDEEYQAQYKQSMSERLEPPDEERQPLEIKVAEAKQSCEEANRRLREAESQLWKYRKIKESELRVVLEEAKTQLPQ
jgi:hypothetical protein